MISSLFFGGPHFSFDFFFKYKRDNVSCKDVSDCNMFAFCPMHGKLIIWSFLILMKQMWNLLANVMILLSQHIKATVMYLKVQHKQ